MGTGDWEALRVGPHPTVEEASTMGYAASDGLRVHFSCCAPPGASGPAVVCLHGWSGSRRYFDHLLGPLAEAGCCVYAPDLRAHGDSTDCGPHGMHVARLAADLREFLELLGAEGRLCSAREGGRDLVTLVGTSMGCAVIWSYIELFGEDLVRSLVLVDQAPLQNREDPLGGAWLLGSTGCYDSETLVALGAALNYAPASAAPAGGLRVPRAFADGNAEACFSQSTPWMEAHPAVLELLAAETLRCSPSALLALMADHTRLDWRPLLPRVQSPAWNCVGVRSKIFPWEGVAWVGDAMPRGRNVRFERGGHWLYLEEPERFAEVVREAAFHSDTPPRPTVD